jgi:hypothetical protein
MSAASSFTARRCAAIGTVNPTIKAATTTGVRIIPSLLNVAAVLRTEPIKATNRLGSFTPPRGAASALPRFAERVNERMA